MATHRIEFINPNLVVIGQELQKHVLDGYTVDDGYPELRGWQYVLCMSREEEDAPVPEQTKKAGRPSGSTKEVLQEKYTK